MGAALSEQETTISYCRESNEAHIWTSDTTVMTKLDRMCKDFPENYKCTEDLYKGQTDRTLAHDWIHEHGWKTMKTDKGWQNICPECKKAMSEKKRQGWLKTV